MIDADSPRRRRWRWRLRTLVALASMGLLLPWLARWLPATGTLAWLIDLALHWQWLYAAVLAVACVGSLFVEPWLAGFAVALSVPFLSASTALPRAEEGSDAEIVLASVNVHVANPDVGAVHGWIRQSGADVVVMLEVSPRMADALSALADYPHRLVHAEESPFGLAVLSRWPLIHAAVTTDDDDVARFEAAVDAPGGRFHLVAFHPVPPISALYRERRDHALSIIAAEAGAAGMPVVIAGDFNATPWTPSLHALARSGLLRATGIAPTWPATWWGGVGIPIDQVLASREWRVISRDRIAVAHSDHRGIIVRLARSGSARLEK